MIEQATYDVAIIGGGLAGLSLSILMAKQQRTVVLFEKEKYPFTKVCGEYISLESYGFLERLGMPLAEMDLPIITELLITSPSGKELRQKLPLGGFGISRYWLDNELKKIAEGLGVKIYDGTKVFSVDFENNIFGSDTTAGKFRSTICTAAFGKRSNLDVAWKRPFIAAQKKGLNNYIGVKYHVTADLPAEQIALHNFKDGYCGISRIEAGNYCLCYLTTAANLKASGNNMEEMERNILSENPQLKKIFSSVNKLDNQPVTISQVSFEQKSLIQDHVIMLGDAAGMITPLCGNGMSMAMHSASLFSAIANEFLSGKISRAQMENHYQKEWNKYFKKRLQTGRLIQRFFGKKSVTNLFIGILKLFPFVVNKIIKQTHGKPF